MFQQIRAFFTSTLGIGITSAVLTAGIATGILVYVKRNGKNVKAKLTNDPGVAIANKNAKAAKVEVGASK